MIAEEFRIGGTCVIRGCVPKKLLVYASRFADAFRDAAGFGWTRRRDAFRMAEARRGQGEGDHAPLRALPRQSRRRAASKSSNSAPSSPGLIRCALADGRKITAQHILVATGAWPDAMPVLEGMEHTISSNEIFDLPTFPRRLLVVGGGYIAVEFASSVPQLGAEVTQVMRAGNVLRGFDEDMRDGCARRCSASASNCASAACPSASEDAGRLARTLSPTARGEGGSGADRHGTQAQHEGTRAGGGGRGARPDRRRRRRRGFDEPMLLDPRRRRRDEPDQSDAGRDPRGPCARRPSVRRQGGRGGPRTMSRARCSRRRKSARSA